MDVLILYNYKIIFSCCAASEIHKIPIERIEEDSDEYRKIWKKMLQLVSAGVKDGQYPPLYCLVGAQTPFSCLVGVSTLTLLSGRCQYMYHSVFSMYTMFFVYFLCGAWRNAHEPLPISLKLLDIPHLSPPSLL